MKVYLKNGWLAPNGHFYPKGAAEIPDNLKGKLPSSVTHEIPPAVEIKAPKKRPTTLVGDLGKQKQPETLAQADTARVAAEIVQETVEAAESVADLEGAEVGVEANGDVSDEEAEARMARIRAAREAAGEDEAPRDAATPRKAAIRRRR